MAEQIAENFENLMKKGFISTLILLVLENKASHGYEIGKFIKERTLGIWDLPSSTIYTILKDMTEKGLLDYHVSREEGRERKVYKITPKGLKTLKMILQKHQIIKDTFTSLKAAMLDDEAKVPLKFFPKLMPALLIERLDKKTDEEKLEFLEVQKRGLSMEITRLNWLLKKIDEIIEKLKKKMEVKLD
ncbi:MAG: PadR family transcriptional regulator [Promethearchaeota archaeon]